MDDELFGGAGDSVGSSSFAALAQAHQPTSQKQISLKDMIIPLKLEDVYGEHFQ